MHNTRPAAVISRLQEFLPGLARANEELLAAEGGTSQDAFRLERLPESVGEIMTRPGALASADFREAGKNESAADEPEIHMVRRNRAIVSVAARLGERSTGGGRRS